MSQLRIISSTTQQTTSIPNGFFDSYMAEANGEFLKVYLYLCRWSTDPLAALSIANIADSLSMTEGDVMRALKYWQKKDLIHMELDDNQHLVALGILDIKPSNAPSAMPTEAPVAVAPLKAEPAKAVEAIQKPTYSMEEVRAFAASTPVKSLFFVIEQYINRPLSPTDLNTIMFFHENLGLSPDLIEYLIEYCVAGGHTSFRYIEKVAIDWSQRGIDTVAKAKTIGNRYSKVYYEVLKAFGITGRGPAPAEATYIKRWSETYGFNEPMIIEACTRTIKAMHQPNFDYAEKILSNWKDKKAFDKKALETLDADHDKKVKAKSTAPKTSKTSAPNRFHNFDERAYDHDDIEKKLLHKLQSTTDK